MRRVNFLCMILSASATNVALAADWPHFAGNARRQAHAVQAPEALSADLWTLSQSAGGAALVFEGPSSPIVFAGRIYANARELTGSTHTANKLVAIGAADGEIQFETPIMKSALNSWSSPAVDAIHGTVLLGCGNRVYAIDAIHGGVAWSTPLARNIVNASVAVAENLVPGRAFITDYDGNGTSAALYCLNTSAFDSESNPHLPGEIVWQEAIGGSSGNSPAYHDGVVYVTSVTAVDSPGFPGVGQLYAFDVDAPAGERLLWSAAAGEGFFGGVTVTGGYVFAASYDPFGGQDNSMLVKARAADGAIQWTVACERTNSIPVVDGERIYLSAGIPGFGSTPKVQAFVDHGTFATKLWDTHVDTSGALVVGGWTHQPVLSEGVLYCGRITSGNVFFGAYVDMYLLDVARMPADSAFVIDHRAGFGSSPAISDGQLYSIGPDGLHAVAALGDVCGGDGVVNGADVQCFVDMMLAMPSGAAQIAICDFDGDGMLSVNDMLQFVERLTNE